MRRIGDLLAAYFAEITMAQGEGLEEHPFLLRELDEEIERQFIGKLLKKTHRCSVGYRHIPKFVLVKMPYAPFRGDAQVGVRMPHNGSSLCRGRTGPSVSSPPFSDLASG